MSDLPTSKYFSLADLRTLTPARVALGRSGISLPTSAQLAFALDHARARDAVHTPFDAEGVAAAVAAFKREVVHVASRASSRADYLRRPDLGRQLDDACRDLLASQNPAASDVTIVIGDGLSAAAVHAHAVSVLNSLLAQLRPMNVTIGQIILATNARVALGDDIGLLLRARMTVMLIGERPGLSAPDSLGAYVTYDPKPGRTDADRNCVSNIHRAGLGCEEAAFKIAWLVQVGLARGLTGVALKDESGGVRPVAVSREPTMLSGNSAALPP